MATQTEVFSEQLIEMKSSVKQKQKYCDEINNINNFAWVENKFQSFFNFPELWKFQ